MTKENKKLLLIDLCARLPYGIKCQYNCIVPGVMEICNAVGELQGIVPFDNTIGFMIDLHRVNALYDNIRPYLRPLSSMTEEECKELGELPVTIENVGETLPNAPYYIEVARPEQIDWLNVHHFDFRGLIEKGLALEAPEGMYKTE